MLQNSLHFSYLHYEHHTPTIIVRLLQPKLESDRRGPSSSSLSGDSRFCGEKLAAVAALVGVLFAWFWEKLDELNMLTWARDREGEGRARPGVTVSLSHNTPQNTHTIYSSTESPHSILPRKVQ